MKPLATFLIATAFLDATVLVAADQQHNDGSRFLIAANLAPGGTGVSPVDFGVSLESRAQDHGLSGVPAATPAIAPARNATDPVEIPDRRERRTRFALGETPVPPVSFPNDQQRNDADQIRRGGKKGPNPGKNKGSKGKRRQGSNGGAGGFNATGVNALSEYAPSRGDKHEMEALASKGFTWLTGSPADNDVSAVGKSAQYFGFVSLRYSSARAASRGGAANAFYAALNPEQRRIVLDLVQAQQAAHDAYAESRKQIMRELETVLYTGRELDEEQLAALGGAYGRHDTAVALLQARAYGQIRATLSTAQQTALRDLRARVIAGDSLETAGDKQGGRRGQKGPINADARGLSQEQRHELINICGKGFTWLTGSPKDNDSLPLGKPGMFFGFISLRQKSGQSVSRAGVAWEFVDILTPAQQAILRETAKTQHPLVDAYLAKRTAFLRHLEGHLNGTAVDEEFLMKLGVELGDLDVKVGVVQARAYAAIRESLDEKQMAALMDLRARNTVDSESLAGLSLAERGERLAFLCVSCHSTAPGEIKTGPSLHGILNRPAASLTPFPYSPALQTAAANGLTWTPENLERFLASPKSMLPGTSMTFRGFLHEADRQAVLDYIRSAWR